MKKLIASLTLLSFVATSCGGSKQDKPPPQTTPGSAAPIKVVKLEDAPDGIDLRLSDGKQGAPAYDRAQLVPAKKLTAQEADALLARAKPITKDATDQQSFALRPGSQPPPRTGEVIKGQFPPPPSSLLPPAANDAGQDLQVLRYMPEGEVPIAPELSVTFSSPMVAITSQDDAAKTTPVKLTPTPKGRWRWIGTRTILFDPEIRFPMATTYTVEVPAGTKATNGNALKQATKFTFETPPPTIAASYPYSGAPQHLDVPMFVLFDQKIDPQAVVAKIKVTADGRTVPVRMMSAAEIEQDKDKELAASVERAKKGSQDGRWVAFRATQKLPADAQVTVEIGAGTPSAEGPNVTKRAQSFSFRTYPPLRVDRAECSYQNRNCTPQHAFTIYFNNPLDADKFDESMIRVSPDISDLRVHQNHAYVSLQGTTTARTTYKVTISSKVPDEFGQTLGKDSVHTWPVGDARPTFYGPTGLVVLDPLAAKRSLDFFTTNYEQLKVRLYKVTPADYAKYGVYTRNLWNKNNPPTPPGDKVFDQLVKTSVGANSLVETSVDLKAALDKDGHGHVLAIVEPHPWTERWDPPRMISWVQSTKLAVDAHIDHESLVAFVTELETGKPAANVDLELKPSGLTAKTDAQGMATIPLPATATGGSMLLARRGGDVAFVPEHGGYWSEHSSWHRRDPGKRLAWYVIDDRKLYKPGEEVTLTGWLRTIDHNKQGDVGPLAGIGALEYKVFDSRNNEIAKGETTVSAVGGFATKFTLPKTPNLGHARVHLVAKASDPWNATGGEHHHRFQIEEFRTPEFEVTAAASQGPFVIGQGGDVTVSAKYYSGGPLPGAPVQWHVTASRGSFTPPNRDDFVFGSWEPWWHHRGFDDDHGQKPPKHWTHTAKTDGVGEHVLHMDFVSAKPAVPMSVQAHASVTDVNRQMWTASSTLLVHPAAYYVGLRAKKPFVEKGKPFELDVIGVDLDGKAVPGAKIELAAVRLDYEYKKGRYTPKEVDPQACAVVAAADPRPCSFKTKEGGTYKVTATIYDAAGRPNQTTMRFWVSGGNRVPARNVAQEEVQLIPDKKEYAPGTTAELLVQAPFYPAEGIVSWRRSGIVKTERITLQGPTAVVKVPIAEAMTPNLHVQVDLVGAAPRLDDKGEPDPKLPKRPAYAVGSINLPIPPKQRTLAVEVKPAAPKVGPGEATKLAVTVRDAAGKPVANADAAVIVVDEAVLALTGYKHPDPIDTFYGHRGPGARDHYLRAHVKLARPDAAGLTRTVDTGATRDGNIAFGAAGDSVAEESAAAPGAPPPPAMEAPAPDAKPAKQRARRAEAKDADEEDRGGSQAQQIAVRSNFNPLAAFAAAVKTDANGRATVDIKVPDNLTRYRIVAIATAGAKQFGKGEESLIARLPLMVRPSPPRFLNFGDTFQLPVVVQNQTDAPMTVRLAARTTNATLTDGTGREVTVPANDRVEVRFPAAAEMAGIARFQIVGSAGTASDAAELALPVWTPATTEAFATYGVIDDGAIKQKVELPGAVVTQFGGIDVTTASTNLQSLTDALLYLVKYPYECAEQRASRIMAVAALRDVLAAFKTEDMPSAQAMESSVATDIERLAQLQNYDGGFAFWERGRPSEPYVTVYVVNALARAKQKGYPVAANLLERGTTYLRNIESHYPHWYSKEIRETISSYALYTRKQLGDLDVAKAKKLYADAGGATKLSMEANGWLLGTMAGQATAAAERQAIVRHALNKVSETAGAANFTTSYGDGAYVLLASNRRVDAIMLESLIQDQPKLDLIPKIVTGLLAHRKAGRWLNTQENTFALLAMDRYFQTYEKVTPDFVARVWLGNDYAGDHKFKGRTTDTFTIPIPMKAVAAHDKQDLTIQKDGKGRLYYRIGMTYAPASLKLAAADYGFVVEREYEGVDDPKDVVRQPDGTWKIKAGARVRVNLKMVNENRRYHVALVDPMPAGLEPMNPALATTGPIPTDPAQQQTRDRYWWWYGPWYEHQNMRDERVEAFAALLWEGVHSYSYVARATTPGNFVVPPPKAEEMYMPETFGRGASDRVIVE